MFSVVINLISFAILCLYFYGRSLRRSHTQRHWKTMCLVIGLDLALVLFLVFARSALSKVNQEMPVQLMIHIGFAISTVVLYGFALHTGFQLKAGNRQYLGKMRKIDRILTPMRVMTLVTSAGLMFF